MVLKRNQQKLQAHPNAELLLPRLQQEYDALLVMLNDYYAAKKQLIASKKQKFIADVEQGELGIQYAELRRLLTQQQQSWQFFIEKLA
jgi:stearoyl-CoA desaturase (delta-9 desaturase)